MGEYIEQIMARSNVVRALAQHYGLDYGTALVIAEAHRRRSIGLGADAWEAEAISEARSHCGSAFSGFAQAMETIMVRRFGSGAVLAI